MYIVKKLQGRTYILNPNDNTSIFTGKELDNLENYELFKYRISPEYVMQFYRFYQDKEKKILSRIDVYVFITDISKDSKINLNQENIRTSTILFLVGYLSFSAYRINKEKMKIFYRGAPTDVDFFYSFSELYINKPFRKNNLVLFFQYIFGLFIQEVELIYESPYFDRIAYILKDVSGIPHPQCIYCNYYDPTTIFSKLLKDERPGTKFVAKHYYNIRPEFLRKNYNNKSFQSKFTNGTVLTKSSTHFFLPKQRGDFIHKITTKLLKLKQEQKDRNLGVVLLETLLYSKDFHILFLEFNNNKAKFLN